MLTEPLCQQKLSQLEGFRRRSRDSRLTLGSRRAQCARNSERTKEKESSKQASRRTHHSAAEGRSRRKQAALQESEKKKLKKTRSSPTPPDSAKLSVPPSSVFSYVVDIWGFWRRDLDSASHSRSTAAASRHPLCSVATTFCLLFSLLVLYLRRSSRSSVSPHTRPFLLPPLTRLQLYYVFDDDPLANALLLDKPSSAEIHLPA